MIGAVAALLLMAAAPGDAFGRGPPQAQADENADPLAGICRVEEPALGLLDSAQSAVYRAVCGTTLWFDGFFGEPSLYEGAGETYGRINLGTFWDERDGIDPKIRVRARVTLPALEQRTKLLLGVGDAADLIDGTADSYSEPTDQTFTRDENDDLLLGLGYTASARPRRGFDLEAGVKVGLPLDPYAGVNYRWYERLGEDWYVRLRLRGFWFLEEQFGTSFTTSVDYTLTPAVMLRLAAFTKVSGETIGLDWRSRVTAFQRLDNDRALSYSFFVRGESDAEVPVRDYGLELRFRRRTFREWFFVEWIAGVSWPRDSLDEIRRLNPGTGIEFEMHFGRRRRATDTPLGGLAPPPREHENANRSARASAEARAWRGP